MEGVDRGVVWIRTRRWKELPSLGKSCSRANRKRTCGSEICSVFSYANVLYRRGRSDGREHDFCVPDRGMSSHKEELSSFFSYAQVLKPMDLTRQSLPFVYMTMDLTSNDGQSHDVQVYSDVTGGKMLSGSVHTTDASTFSLNNQSGFQEPIP